MIQEPRINALHTSANPLMIVGIFIFIAPFFMDAFGQSNPILKMIFFGVGVLMFVLGLVMYIGENY